MEQIVFVDIEDIKVGHAQNLEAGTGCTVVICEKGATAGIDVRGGAPGTRESDLLNPVNLVKRYMQSCWREAAHLVSTQLPV
mgnify:CR=1 FL=1